MIRSLLYVFILMFAWPVHASVVYYLVAMPEPQVPELVKSEVALTQALFEGQNPDRLYLDKAWHGIHWLLAKSAGSTDEPLSKLIMGGKPVGVKLPYGQPRVHTAAEVKRFASLLDAVDIDKLAKNYDVAAMDAAYIYPEGWGDEPDNLEILKSFFVDLRDFYRRAAKDGKAVLYAWS
ncbi:YfbM family protein [Steroidobacter flavus]|uniref:YfbM family protein n=1 Tax=Steroidobacter flavus TaxID=1842136 RepID=A0ABV8SSU0_9GAMM